MKKLILKILTVIVFTLLSTGILRSQNCASEENIYSFVYDGRSYEVVKEQQKWDDAAACAVERGGYLVEISSHSEQTAVYEAIIDDANVPSDYVTVFDGGSIAYVWIGATDKKSEGIWLWDGDNDGEGVNFWTGEGNAGDADGSPVGGAYNNWGGVGVGPANEPDNYQSSQHYGAIGLNGWPNGSGAYGVAGEWNDIKAVSSLYYVIEYDSLTVIPKIGYEINIEIFPNPVSNSLNLSLPEIIDNIAVAIFDGSGKIVLKRKYSFVKDIKIDVSNLIAGYYFIEISSGNEVVSKKKILVR